jgi:hypothetical protein
LKVLGAGRYIDLIDESSMRYFCKYCKVWLADDKPSRSLHDNGAKHKQKVLDFNKEKKEAKLAAESEAARVERELANADRAARAAMAQDFGSSVMVNGGQQPEKNSANTYTHEKQVKIKQEHNNFQKDSTIAPVKPIDNNVQQPTAAAVVVKIIEEGGLYFMEGGSCVDDLLSGVTCEYYNDAVSKWVPAVISVRTDTDILNPSFDVTFFDVSGEGGGIPDMATGVRADQIRLPVDEDTAKVMVSSRKGVVEVKPVMVESTGLGVWQSVEVVEKESDDGSSSDESEDNFIPKAKSSNKMSFKKRNVQNMLGTADDDSNNNDSYKGVRLDTFVAPEPISLSKGAGVTFKKKSGFKSGGRSEKKFRVKDADVD